MATTARDEIVGEPFRFDFVVVAYHYVPNSVDVFQGRSDEVARLLQYLRAANARVCRMRHVDFGQYPFLGGGDPAGYSQRVREIARSI